MHSQELRHLISDAPRVMVVDGSKMVRKMIADVLKRELPGVEVIGCATIAEARQALEAGAVHLVTTSLALPDGDGVAVAEAVAESGSPETGFTLNLRRNGTMLLCMPSGEAREEVCE